MSYLFICVKKKLRGGLRDGLDRPCVGEGGWGVRVGNRPLWAAALRRM